MESRFRFVYGSKTRTSARAGSYVVTATGGGSFTLGEREFELAMLFDGLRSLEDVMDAFAKRYEVAIERQQLEQFVQSLLASGLLEEDREDAAVHSSDSPVAPTGSRHGKAARRDRGRGPASSAGARRDPRIRLLFTLPVRWLLPLGTALAAPSRSRWLSIPTLALMCLCLYGLWDNRVQLTSDLERFFQPLVLAQTLLFSLLTVSLFGQLSRAATARHLGHERPRFGVALAFNIIPRFYADLSDQQRLSTEQRVASLKASLFSNIVMLDAACLVWLINKNSGTMLPLFAVGLIVLSTLRLLLSLNPLAKRAGYYLLANRLGATDLREQAIISLLPGRMWPSPKARALPRWALRWYGLAVVGYLLFVTYLIVWIVGGWLEAHWGGLGVTVFVTLCVLAFYGPLKQTRRALRFAEVRYRDKHGRGTAGRWLKWAAVVTVTVLAFVPYRYESGGELVVLPREKFELRALVEGDIKAIHAADGQQVRHGEVLAHLTSDEERRNIAVAEARIEQLVAKQERILNGARPEQVAVAEQHVQTAATRLEFSQRKATRYQRLHETGMVSSEHYDAAAAAAERERHLLEEAKRHLETVEADPRQEEIAVVEAEIAAEFAVIEYNRTRLQYTELRAPADGVLGLVQPEPEVGTYLERGDLIGTVERTDSLLVEIRVPQFDYELVSEGDPVRLRFRSLPGREFDGVIERIVPAADRLNAQTFKAITRLDNSEGLFKPALTGYAKIRSESMPAALALSRAVVRFVLVRAWSWLP